jgi:rod shape-determining protein MreD
VNSTGWLSRFQSRYWILAASILGALLLESTVFPHLAVFGLKPDLLMVVVACWAILYGPQEGFIAGLAAGLTQDVVFGQYIGLFALAKVLTGFFLGVVAGKVFGESLWVSTGAVGVGLFAHEAVVWVALRALGIPVPAHAIITVALPAAVYGMLFAPLVYRQLLLYRLAEWAREKEMTNGGASHTAGRR